MCSPLSAASLKLVFLNEGEDHAMVERVVRQVATTSLLSRIEGEGEMVVTLSFNEVDSPYALSVVLNFAYEEKELAFTLSQESTSKSKLERSLQKQLSSVLLYDGLLFLEQRAAVDIAYTYKQGYAVTQALPLGKHYLGYDSQGTRRGSAVVRRVTAVEEPLSLLVSTGGNILLPGMALSPRKGREVQLSYSHSFAGDYSLQGLYSQDIGLYPFRLVGGVGATFTENVVKDIYTQVGLSVEMPLSLLMNIEHEFWRNSSLAMRSTLSLGSCIPQTEFLLGGTFLASYRYALTDWVCELGMGRSYWTTEKQFQRVGLFIHLGLAYTW